jgi:pimeloyl-ACP methyl ester carboxylesterase
MEGLSAQEFNLQISNGLRLGGKSWGDIHSNKRILALHGWLDNSATWDEIAPFLAGIGYLFIAIDFIGHGKSDHLDHAEYSHLTHVVTVKYAVEALNWDSFILFGHSMGGIIATIFAGAMPHLVEKLVLVEGLLWLTSERPISHSLGQALEDRASLFNRQPRVYGTLTELVDRLKKNNPDIAPSSAFKIVRRSMLKVPGGYCFSHDPRLIANSLYRPHPLDCLDILGNISCPVLLFFTKNTLKKWNVDFMDSYQQAFKPNILNFVLLESGTHHVHLDNADLLLDHIISFLNHSPKL